MFRFIAAESANHPVSLMCRVLGASLGLPRLASALAELASAAASPTGEHEREWPLRMAREPSWTF